MDVLSDVITTLRLGEPHASRTVPGAHWRQRLEGGPAAGFHAVVRGSCRLVPETGPPISLHVGDVAFLPHGAAHTLQDARPADRTARRGTDLAAEAGSTVLLCGGYMLDGNSRAHPMFTALPDVLLARADDHQHRQRPAGMGRPEAPYPALEAALTMLAQELQRPGPGSRGVVASLVDMTLLFVLRSWFASGDHNGRWSATLADPAVSVALRAIHQAPAEPWTVARLAAEAGLSRAPFARRFAAAVGWPPATYLTWWRMTLAARALQSTDRPLRQVSHQVGYASEFAFAKAFRRQFGLAPGAYRRSRQDSGRSGALEPVVGGGD